MSIEGQLAIELLCQSGRIQRVSIRSSRPLQLPLQFAGKRVAEVLRTLPMLYSICATAQAGAAATACRQALGLQVDPRIVLAESILVCFETAREHLWRVLIDWPGSLGETVDRRQLPELSGWLPDAKRLLFHPQGPAFHLQPRLQVDAAALTGLIERLAQILERAVFGISASAWRAMESVAELVAWINDRGTVAARYLVPLAHGDLACLGGSPVAALPPLEEALLHRRLQQPDADAFIAAPEWLERPRETTPLTRQFEHPLIAALEADYGKGLLTRLVARLLELASMPHRLSALLQRLVSGRESSSAVHPVAVSGQGLGVVEAARGRLIHRVTVMDEVIQRYQILAPTEWNFHPRGLVAQGLLGLACGDESGLRRQAGFFIGAVDPCVGYHIEIV